MFLETLLQGLQAFVIPCMYCNTYFRNMPVLYIVAQRVKYGLHVLHEIGNFNLYYQINFIYLISQETNIKL